MTTQTTSTTAPQGTALPLLTSALVDPLTRLDGPPLLPFTDELPPILRLLSKRLELCYRVKTTAMAVTEKNKGGDYHSSGFNIHTTLEVLPLNPHLELIDDALAQHAWQLHGLSAGVLEAAYQMCPQAFAKIVPASIEPQPDVYGQPPQTVELNGQVFNVTYAPLTAQPRNALALNDWHLALYQAYVTKWYEHSANPIPVHTAVATKERQELVHRYELFLCTLLTQYFILTPASAK